MHGRANAGVGADVSYVDDTRRPASPAQSELMRSTSGLAMNPQLMSSSVSLDRSKERISGLDVIAQAPKCARQLCTFAKLRASPVPPGGWPTSSMSALLRTVGEHADNNI